jgi:cobalamin biosynthesis Mg chelatase CobN
MWKADPAVLAEVAEAYVESVAQHGPSNGLTTGGNDALEAFLRPIYEAPGSKVAPEVQARYQQQVRQERGKPPPPSPQRPPPELKGQKLEEVAQPQAQPPAPNPGARWALAVLAFLFATGFVARVLAARRRR